MLLWGKHLRRPSQETPCSNKCSILACWKRTEDQNDSIFVDVYVVYCEYLANLFGSIMQASMNMSVVNKVFFFGIFVCKYDLMITVSQETEKLDLVASWLCLFKSAQINWKWTSSTTPHNWILLTSRGYFTCKQQIFLVFTIAATFVSVLCLKNTTKKLTECAWTIQAAKPVQSSRNDGISSRSSTHLSSHYFLIHGQRSLKKNNALNYMSQSMSAF